MKKSITTIMFIGLFAWLTVDLQAQFWNGHNDHGNGGSASIEIIKGKPNKHHGVWESVSFGLDAPKSYSVVSVEVLDSDGVNALAEYSNFFPYRRNGDTWYNINIEDLRLRGTFHLRITIVNSKDGSTTVASTLLRSLSIASTSAPIEPDETVLIVKFP
jgi:hypothetical protein